MKIYVRSAKVCEHMGQNWSDPNLPGC